MIPSLFIVIGIAALLTLLLVVATVVDDIEADRMWKETRSRWNSIREE